MDGVGVTDGEEEEEGEGVGDTEGEGVRDGVAEDEDEELEEGEDVELGVIEGVGVREGVLVGVLDGVRVREGVLVGVLDGDLEGLREGDGLELGKTLQKLVPVPGTTLNSEFGGQFSAFAPGISQAANVVSPAENPTRLSKPAQCTVVVQCISCVILPA